MVAPIVVKKKLALSFKMTTVKILPSKRLHSITETTGEIPHPSKCVKKLAKKGAREIHVISSHTIGTTAPSASPPTPISQTLTDNQPSPADSASQAQPTPEVPGVVVEPVAAPSVDLHAAPGSTEVPVLGETTHSIRKDLSRNPKHSVVILEEV